MRLALCQHIINTSSVQAVTVYARQQGLQMHSSHLHENSYGTCNDQSSELRMQKSGHLPCLCHYCAGWLLASYLFHFFGFFCLLCEMCELEVIPVSIPHCYATHHPKTQWLKPVMIRYVSGSRELSGLSGPVLRLCTVMAAVTYAAVCSWTLSWGWDIQKGVTHLVGSSMCQLRFSA